MFLSSTLLPTGKRERDTEKRKQHDVENIPAALRRHLLSRRAWVLITASETSADRNAGDKWPWALATGMNMLAKARGMQMQLWVNAGCAHELRNELKDMLIYGQWCMRDKLMIEQDIYRTQRRAYSNDLSNASS
jgi:hypothetical protein